jgi:dihydrofolate reductase
VDVSILFVTEFVSLDGVVEAPGGEPTHPQTGWTIPYHGPDNMAYKLAEVHEAESLMIGRTTYDSFAAAWPGYEGEFADKMNSMPKYVVSSTLESAAWNNTTVLRGDWAAQVAELKARDGGPIMVTGSASLVKGLLDRGLVDELRLMVFPVMIGGGLRCFPDDRGKVIFELADTQAYANGVVLHTYRTVSA